ncbi:iron complex transport system substrate-binding protein [Corynebacterium appendicis CIP 107643]|uniref:Iron complex transport system substrate-binding protein n=1 Tax=Corynebacterium appendicis CIP 107643 TaxID=1161099 RepID=A0A1N7JY87_9CORY|nr:ABC transporter substrate-binding protein [Corynebacterium appendicis]WJY60573.1 corrinoid ABC transporter substrate-binding protein [Corynebacterium appendicis CIP 107643]SIS54206.1 iron complex transport system substrate-binding protein [Corynebacterium appendicis CIP 107643]
MKFPRTLAALLFSFIAVLGLAGCSSDSSGGDAAGSNGDEKNGEAVLTVTDAAGRTVDFDKQPERILLAEGRGIFATSILQDNPFDKVVAYGDDFEKAAPAMRDKILEKFPEGKDLPQIGSLQKGDATVENLLAQKPDVVMMTLDQKKVAEQNGFLSDMDAVGLKYVFTDFRQDPLNNTEVSMKLFGDIFGASDRAESYNKFWSEKAGDITDRVGAITEKPKTVVWMAAGFMDCCTIAGDANLGKLVDAAGGHNVGPEILGTDETEITPEKLVEVNPDKLIVTGGEWARDPQKADAFSHVELGYQADEAAARESFGGPLHGPGMEQLTAPKEGDFFAVYHQFYDSPYNVFALEAFAKWLHPEEFGDLDPAKDFEDFNAEWMPIDYSGTFFLDGYEAE